MLNTLWLGFFITAAISALAQWLLGGQAQVFATMVESLFAEFAKIFPMRFTNVTNGVNPRRWLALANPPLSKVLDENIGHTWRTDLSQLK